jgi:hypothetical protein
VAGPIIAKKRGRTSLIAFAIVAVAPETLNRVIAPRGDRTKP